jgi:hypothetical protein
MDLTGRLVHFWLSPSGKGALNEVIPGGADFEALVVEEDGIGLWLWVPHAERESREVTLLKWEYFAAATLEYQPEVPRARPATGFQAPNE